MKLITEEVEKIEVITENVNGKKTLCIQGVFLQSECVNRNGRMYPFSIMEREVKRYNENYVNKGRALGELGHPCLSGDAKLLSVKDGWKHIQDSKEGEEIYTINPKTKEVEVQSINKVIINHHEGFLYQLKNRGINTKITPDHRFLIINSRNHNDYQYITAQEIYDDLNGENKLSKWYIPKYSLGLNKEAPEYYVIPKSDTIKSITNKTKKYLNDLHIEFNTFSAFLGIYLSEGSCSLKDNGSYQIGIFQNEGSKAEQIREILNSMTDLEWYESCLDQKVIFTCYDRRLGEYLYKFGKCYTKYIAKDYIEQVNADNARTFIDYFVLGDGRGTLNKKYCRCDCFSASKQLIDDISQIATIAGIGIAISEELCENDYVFAGRIIEAKNKSPLYFCTFLNTKGVYLDNRFIEMTKEDWNDNVYCVQVDNTNFMVQQNGYTYWTGNCGPTVNLDRVSHIITELYQVKNNFMGKARIIPTPMGKIAEALLNSGVTLGVSSRGIGSLRETRCGHKEVGDDFMLATAADIVADPSAPDAFVTGIMEGVEWVWNNGILEQKISSIKTKINTFSSQRNLEEHKVQLFNEFLNSL
jgi:hypothetical protein